LGVANGNHAIRNMGLRGLIEATVDRRSWWVGRGGTRASPVIGEGGKRFSRRRFMRAVEAENRVKRGDGKKGNGDIGGEETV
jgi:hypothetical protein